MLRSMLLIIVFALALTGCDTEDKLMSQLEEQNVLITQLRSTIAEKDQTINQMQRERDWTKLDLAQSELELAIQEFPWLEKFRSNTKWDKVVIYRFENDSYSKTIEDPLFLESIGRLLYLKSVSTENYPSGYQTDIDSYTYEFYEGEQQYKIHVVDRGVIEAGRREFYFDVDLDVHQLGVAFMPIRPFIQHDGLIAKMVASGAVKRENQYVQFSSFRVQSRAASLMSAELLKGQPEDIGEKVESYTFYYYGTEIVMDIYQDHVFLSGDGSEEWYYYKDAGIAFTLEAG